ncbi:hypothetical protein TNCV_4055171 [Trichonephila clavipes]|nr:hypothetical protein TNCV_4055171 [Trichonephila clavipes]
MALVLAFSVSHFRFSYHSTDFYGEIEAIHLAFRRFLPSPPNKDISLLDSSSVLQALVSNLEKQSSRGQSCRTLLNRNQTKVAFQWEPFHCGNEISPILWGNEMTDLLEKRGTDILQRSSEDLPFHSAKPNINKIYKKCFRNAADSATKNKHWRVLLKHQCVTDSTRTFKN